MSNLTGSKRKRKSNGRDSSIADIDASKKRKMVTWKESSLEGREKKRSLESDTTEEDHIRLLGLVTGQMQKLPFEGGGEGEMEEEQVHMPKKKRRGRQSRETKEEKWSSCVDQAEPGGSVDKSSALEYLILWDTNRCKWSFKKKTQYWLLQNMYDRQKVCGYFLNKYGG